MADNDPIPSVQIVALPLCDLCLDGAGGECHVPGCALWINRAPDVAIRDKVVATEPPEINWEAATTAVQERLFDLSIDCDRIDSLDRHAAGRLARAAIRASVRRSHPMGITDV